MLYTDAMEHIRFKAYDALFPLFLVFPPFSFFSPFVAEKEYVRRARARNVRKSRTPAAFLIPPPFFFLLFFSVIYNEKGSELLRASRNPRRPLPPAFSSSLSFLFLPLLQIRGNDSEKSRKSMRRTDLAAPEEAAPSLPLPPSPPPLFLFLPRSK